jgi:hypothetical protein
VLLERRAREGILDGSVTVLVRRWRRPGGAAGRTYRTAAGLIAVDEVRVIDPATVTDAEAGAAGYRTSAELRADLRGEPDSPTFLLRVRPADGPDPRTVLAESTTSPTPTSPTSTAVSIASTAPARPARGRQRSSPRSGPSRAAGPATSPRPPGATCCRTRPTFGSSQPSA